MKIQLSIALLKANPFCPEGIVFPDFDGTEFIVEDILDKITCFNKLRYFDSYHKSKEFIILEHKKTLIPFFEGFRVLDHNKNLRNFYQYLHYIAQQTIYIAQQTMYEKKYGTLNAETFTLTETPIEKSCAIQKKLFDFGTDKENAGVNVDISVVSAVVNYLWGIIGEKRENTKNSENLKIFDLDKKTRASLSLEKYVTRINQYLVNDTGKVVGYALWPVAMIYIERIIQSENLVLTESNVFKLLAVSTMLAYKFFEDSRNRVNGTCSQIFGFPTADLNVLEVNFCVAVKFHLNITIEEIQTLWPQIPVPFEVKQESDSELRKLWGLPSEVQSSSQLPQQKKRSVPVSDNPSSLFYSEKPQAEGNTQSEEKPQPSLSIQ